MVERMISMRSLENRYNEKRKITPRFSRVEIRDLLKAWIAISIAFGIVLGGASSLPAFLTMFVVSLITVGIGFLFHELGHKIVAQYYGCWAEFRAFNQMLLFAIFMSFLGFVFAAPGAVMIQGAITKEQNGKISLAGPAINIMLALISLGIITFFPQTGILGMILAYGFRINTFLALFNMIPIGIFDGAKIFKWNKTIWGITIATGLILFFV